MSAQGPIDFEKTNLEAKIKDKELAKKINLAYGSNNATNLILIDFTKSSKEVNRVLDKIKEREEALNKTLTTELINITENIKVNNKLSKVEYEVEALLNAAHSRWASCEVTDDEEHEEE